MDLKLLAASYSYSSFLGNFTGKLREGLLSCPRLFFYLVAWQPNSSLFGLQNHPGRGLLPMLKVTPIAKIKNHSIPVSGCKHGYKVSSF